MAKKNEQAAFGYDPLAWMNEEQDSGESAATEVSKTELEASETKVNQPEAETTEVDSGSAESLEQQDKINMVLDSMLNIQNVNKLYEQLAKTLTHNQIEIDASNVSSIDTSSLQLLVVYKQEAIKMHKQVTFDFPSDKFIDAAELLDLSAMLEIDSPGAGLF